MTDPPGEVRPQPATIIRPTTNTIAPAPALAPPRPRAVDTHDPAVDLAFDAKGNAFFAGAPHTPDQVITLSSVFGFFKVETYPNQGNPNDIHLVVFFYNAATQETYEVHGTIARIYLESVRNRPGIVDFPIADSRLSRTDPRDAISYFSQYSLRWEQSTNRVIKKFYKPFDPAQATIPAKAHEYDPVAKDTLVGYSEEYPIALPTLTYSNWKDEPNLARYNDSIGVRSVGMPTQILLHETAGFGNLSISGVQPRKTTSGGTFFPIPHFCVNNQDGQGKGSIIQFVDLATNVPHGQSTNQRSVGIEFVNAPIEAFKVDSAGRVLQPLQPVFHLDTTDKGLYLKTKLAGFPKLFIPLEFSAEAGGAYYELAVKKDRLINFASLNAGVGPKKTKILTEDSGNVLIKYAKSDKFEHLATLVSALVTNGLINHFDNLGTENFWKPVFTAEGNRFCLFDHAWEEKLRSENGRKVVDTFFFTDIREPGMFTHLLIGSHVDGGLQGLYLYLKFVRNVPTEAILQLMIGFLTSDKTPRETAGIRLTTKLLLSAGGTFRTPTQPFDKVFTDILELDESLITAATQP